MAQAGKDVQLTSRLAVLFWGTPDFGVPALDSIAAAGHRIVGVVTNPDRPAGRGRRLRESPIKGWAVSNEVPVLQPTSPRGSEFKRAVRKLEPDVSVVAAYGQLLRPGILALPRLGSLNIHASLLPKLRGAAPVNWAILRGEAETGVTIIRMVTALDAGPMLVQRRIAIARRTTAGDLYQQLAELGGESVVEALEGLVRMDLPEVAQDESLVTWAPKMTPDFARIDWARTSPELERHLRGCDPWPAAWTTWRGHRIQCFDPAIPVELDSGTGSGRGSPANPGRVVEAHPKRGLSVKTGDGVLLVGAVKPSGRRRMPSAEWVRGVRGLGGDHLV